MRITLGGLTHLIGVVVILATISNFKSYPILFVTSILYIIIDAFIHFFPIRTSSAVINTTATMVFVPFVAILVYHVIRTFSPKLDEAASLRSVCIITATMTLLKAVHDDFPMNGKPHPRHWECHILIYIILALILSTKRDV